VGYIQPRTVIPMHYNTWELIAQDPERFRQLVGERAAVEVLKPGGSYDF
jgi:L-ascorbate metabolism protein UlaG (beta-lactamase superfamily)